MTEQYVIAILSCSETICGYVREDDELMTFESTIQASREINEIYSDLQGSEIDNPSFDYVVQPLSEVTNPSEGL